MSRLLVTFVATLILTCTAAEQQAAPRETSERVPVVGGRCEGCDDAFIGLPEELFSRTRIAPEGQPGEPLIVEGMVRDARGAPAAGVIVYAYHTDDRGVYPTGQTRHGRLRGWAETDADGRYRFDTIRPAGYPDVSVPAHIHMHVIEPERCTYIIDDIHFTDDERLTEAVRRRSQRGRGGSGLVTPAIADDGSWHAIRDIDLGHNVPGYDHCS